MKAPFLDNYLASKRQSSAQSPASHLPTMRFLDTRAAVLRLLDTGGSKPVILIAPDGPTVIEHCSALIEKLSSHFRVICFDFPGLGFSFAKLRYGFELAETADMIVELMDALNIERAALAFTCANGLFGMNLAQRFPSRVSHLIVAQTPSLESMVKWTEVNIPMALRIPYLGQIATATAIRPAMLAERWFDAALPRGRKDKASFVSTAKRAIQGGGCFCLASVVQGLARAKAHELQGVTCPTLAIHGTKDYSHRYTDFKSILQAVPHAKLLAFEGHGHFPDLENTDEYVEQIRRFVLG
jgi:pimeloyl-ACP methyl ester carboxylesterase